MGSQDGVEMAVKTEVLGEWSQTSDETCSVEDRMGYCSENSSHILAFFLILSSSFCIDKLVTLL